MTTLWPERPSVTCALMKLFTAGLHLNIALISHRGHEDNRPDARADHQLTVAPTFSKQHIVKLAKPSGQCQSLFAAYAIQPLSSC